MAAHASIRASWAHRRRSALVAGAVRTVLLLTLLPVCVPPIVRADDFWKHKPARQWSAAEALKLVRRSPWAKLEIVVFGQKETEAAFSVPTGTNHCDPDAIDPN